jgi:hypothetical protein
MGIKQVFRRVYEAVILTQAKMTLTSEGFFDIYKIYKYLRTPAFHLG